MLLEEVLPEHKKGRKIRRKAWESGVFLECHRFFSVYDIEQDDWEVMPEPPVEIDLVEYADGYEFEFSKANYVVVMAKDDGFGCDASFNYRYMGCVYMSYEKAFTLVEKLNSGEWVLK